MSNASLTMIGLDLLMILYTLWVVSLRPARGRPVMAIAVSLIGWLALLHFGLSAQSLFPRDISGLGFLAVIIATVMVVGAVLAIPPLRRLLAGLDQSQLMLLQGIRVFFGAGLLAQAASGDLPVAFGIVDGVTHVSAGFLGLVSAYALSSGSNGARRAWFANLFGLADILVVASSLALLLLPQIGPHHPMMYAVFLPAPLWLWFHLISIARLLKQRDQVGQPVAA
jgi:hypothetical protein